MLSGKDEWKYSHMACAQKKKIVKHVTVRLSRDSEDLTFTEVAGDSSCHTLLTASQHSIKYRFCLALNCHWNF